MTIQWLYTLDLPFADCRGWNVIVGRSYGAFITHKMKSYAYLSVFPGVNVLLWKA